MKDVNNNFLAITLTRKCSLNCKYCFEESSPSEKDEFEFVQVKSLIAEAKSLGIKWIALSGGEPLLYPQIYEVIHEVINNKMALFIETNGQYVDEEFLKTLNSASNKSEILIRISLDSYKKEHHEIDRGLNSFDPAIIAIKALAIKGISVSVNKVYRKSDFDFNFSIKEYIKFCKQLGVSRFEFSRMVPFGRAQEKDLLTSEQIVSVRKSLSEFYNYGKDIISTDFYYLKYSQNCSRLKTKGWGLYAYPYGFSLCPLQPEVKLGDLNSMQNILKQNLLIKFNAMRKEAFKHLPRNMIFGCTECRRYLTS